MLNYFSPAIIVSYLTIVEFKEEVELLLEEKETINRLTKFPLESLNLDAIAVVTNVYRMVQGLRDKMEWEGLVDYGLSWTSFSILYDLWIEESIETKKLAELAGVTKPTVTNITKTLERKDLCYRKKGELDRRTTFMTITDKEEVLWKIYIPSFIKGKPKLFPDTGSGF